MTYIAVCGLSHVGLVPDSNEDSLLVGLLRDGAPARTGRTVGQTRRMGWSAGRGRDPVARAAGELGQSSYFGGR